MLDPFCKQCHICGKIFWRSSIDEALDALRQHLFTCAGESAGMPMGKALKDRPERIKELWSQLLTGEDIEFLRDMKIEPLV